MPDIMSVCTSRKTAMVTTSHDYPPIPMRGADWSAVVSETYDPENNCPVGYGKTEGDAILDLLRETMDDVSVSLDFVNALEGYLVYLMEDLPKEHYVGFRRCIREVMGVLE